ncbi:hypothetical protein LX15_000607 [Streptoalloteichus tenebrarius]|uniref:Aspartate kinase n=1 Tax=Streptoalloteichus tenebrarius (strain ATCC 17920 / DSM 40477 / JCM 4838 / CBS 697.72 / NBRC 16177 / NCIMB 11028 / NRRL B-12390 / A12253. 1 / ISP 5477) TaxID=1933 RepID=A0ABT1HN42_STRSD|nr:ACT domain-containing protein [Streptoalloteichus tenebrarius]MCP2256924.1 hypothetical protein [Streptoalloteichus tenebrarius]BFF00167.1 ACT domain-containing protein [Streptoalloteichus tenebrarius]
MPGLTLDVLPGRHAVARLAPDHPVPADLWRAAGLVSVTRTVDELSVVCPEAHAPAGARVEGDWRVLTVRGPLDFALTGILADLAGALAEAGISLFAVSTFDTDHVLVREKDLDGAVAALRSAGHDVAGHDVRGPA